MVDVSEHRLDERILLLDFLLLMFVTVDAYVMFSSSLEVTTMLFT